MVLKPSRVKTSPQWGLPPDQLIKQIKDGMEAAKEAIEQVAETLPRIQKVKQELANEWMADCKRGLDTAIHARRGPGRTREAQRTTSGTWTEMLVQCFGSLFSRLGLFFNCPLFGV